MADAAELLKIIKRTVADTIHSMKVSDLCFGEVVSAEPIKILIDQKFMLGERQLILTRNVTEYELEMTVEHFTENEAGHRHEYKGKKKFVVHNALTVGEKVVLIRQHGGQKYLVVDRI